MAKMSKAGDGGAVLFCPFCRECFEGEETCPEHELVLVPFVELPEAKRRAQVGEGERVGSWDLGYGRGYVFLGSALMFIGFLGSFVRSNLGGGAQATGLELASTVAVNLWVVPCVATSLVAILMRRRTLGEMRGARVALPLVAMTAGASLVLTFYKVHTAAAMIAERVGEEIVIDVLWGVWVVALGVLVAIYGGARAGHVVGPPDE